MGLDEQLDERKVKILKAIIKNYLETGEPVGSRTISKFTDMKLSSATIRNEMADLEELGYIVQPHTSAGRIPTDKGYRLYVDDMMSEKEQNITNRENEVAVKEQELSSMKDMLGEKVEKVEELLQNVAKVLAKDTNYATMVTTPKVTGNKLKFVQLSQLEANKILAVIVMEGNLIRNKVITVSEDLSQENLLKLNILINTTLTGLTLEQMNLSIVSKMENQAGEHINLVKEVLDAIVDTISSADDLKIYTSGATNIFKYPELSDSTKASELIYALEEKQSLSDIKVMVVDDNQYNREIACELLRENGAHIIECASGSEAVDYIKYRNGIVDIILMDVCMPDMDGFEATRLIRQLEKDRWQDIPIVAMTANAFDEDRKKALEHGMNGHIAKPFDIDTFAETVLEYVKY